MTCLTTDRGQARALMNAASLLASAAICKAQGQGLRTGSEMPSVSQYGYDALEVVHLKIFPLRA